MTDISYRSLKQIRENLRNYFLGSLVGGILLIIIFFWSSSEYYIVFIPLIPMLFYIISGYQIANKYKHMPDFSDSVYYLGFIFTLVSLLCVVLFTKISNEPTKLLNYFGMSLSTTILGIAFRSIHHQFTNLSHDPINTAQKELREEVDKFRSSIDLMKGRIDEVSTMLITQLPQKLVESVNQFDEKFQYASSILNNNMNDLVRTTKDISLKTNQGFSNLHDSVDLSIVNISKMSDSIEKVSNENIESLSNSADKVSSVIDTSINNYSNKLSVSIEKMSVSTSKILDEFVKVQQHISNYTNILDSNNQSNFLRTTLDSMEKSNNDFIELSKKIKDTASSWERTNDTFKDTTQTLRKEIDKIKEMFNEMGNLVEKNIK